jgi:hypothetical protein
MNNELNIRLFKQIAEGFNLTEGEIAKTLQLSPQGLKNAIKDCFRQIEQPREKFSAEDYKYLTEELGCINLEEQLENEPMLDVSTMAEDTVRILFNMPIKFTVDDVKVAMYLRHKDAVDTPNEYEDAAKYIVDLLSHPKVKCLIKDGEYYSLNLNAKIG